MLDTGFRLLNYRNVIEKATPSTLSHVLIGNQSDPRLTCGVSVLASAV